MRRDNRPTEERPSAPTQPATRNLREFRPTLAMALTVVLVLGGLAFAGLAVWVMLSKKTPATTPGGTAPNRVAVEGKANRKVPAPAVNELEDQVRAFLKVRNPEELSGMIRKGAQEPAAMVEKLAKTEEIDGKLKQVKYLFPLQSRCLQLEAVLVDFVGGRNRLALLAPDAEGKWKIDFDGFDRYCSSAWETLLSGGETEGKVRVNISIDAYYNGHFRDEGKWVCYGMQSPDQMESMFCYAQRASVQHKALDGLLATQDAADSDRSGRASVRRVILGVRHLPNTDKRQFEITRVYSDDWAEGDKALDEIVAEDEKAAQPKPEPAPDK